VKTDSSDSKEIVINGVRYKTHIRLDTSWTYSAEWSDRMNSPPFPVDEAGGSASRARKTALDEIRKAHLIQEPWLSVEIA
jgi:hypothetical protein